MRNIGQCETAEAAQRFASYLASLHIENEIRENAGRWALWVYSEDDVKRAAQEFAAFAKDSSAPRYRVAFPLEALKPKPAPVRAVPLREIPGRSIRRTLGTRAPITTCLIALSVAISAVPFLGRPDIIDYLQCHTGLVLQGQVWRLITPIFIHFTIPHILFNVLWLQYLGTMIESIKGARFFLGLTLVLAVASNLLQAVVAGPSFGGMSGVVYGYFGYAWMKSKYEPFSGLLMDPITVVLMMVWFGFCMTKHAGPIANWAHGAGLVMGMAFGVARTVWLQIQKR